MAARRTTHLVRALAAGLLAAGMLGTTGTAQAVTHTWGNVMEVPGTGTLNSGGFADVVSIACTTAGNCSAGGLYQASAGTEAMVVDEVNGTWGIAQEVPGTAVLNAGGDAEVRSISCASAGNCSAGGYYDDSKGMTQAFVADEVNGVWGNAREVPGTGALNAQGFAQIDAVSCKSAGNCSAGGEYTDSGNHTQAFVVNRVNGTWHTAREVPGTAALNVDGIAEVHSLSCAAAGNCAAVGRYRDSAGHFQAFVVTETSGTWHTAREIPGTSSLNAQGDAVGNGVSCRSSGNCSAGGSYVDSSGHQQAFVVNEVSGTWRTARAVPGIGTLEAGGSADLTTLSCGSAGNCSAGGNYNDSAAHEQGFVVNQVNGTWRNAVPVPGLSGLNSGNVASVKGLSCASAGNCSAGGFFEDSVGHVVPFVVDETSGSWQTAQQVSDSSGLNAGSMAIETLSCGSTGTCGAGGNYKDSSNAFQAFVVNRS